MPDITEIATPDWIEAARREMRREIGTYEKAMESRKKAERIRAALLAYGASDIPPLPWAGRTPKRPALEKTCVTCGRTAPFGAFRATPDGPVCRQAEACEARERTDRPREAVPA
jgi:hypothetical protein